ncbi:hypothetical protein [Flavobacterium sp. J27]|uniref:hypothetical protein n=1 Tax=Flavobacterium sp. J27 TaxID=2060419 RepID=UPI0010313262|nr:hypothetical protein [Flavobacterium sp. J27]
MRNNRTQRLVALTIVLIIICCIEIWFLNNRKAIPTLSLIGSIFGGFAIGLYLYGIAKVLTED